MAEELTKLGALEQAALVRSGAVSSEELVQAHLARIARCNPELQAFVTVSPRALAAARAKDAERRRTARDELPPFHGVPIGVKDLNLVRGMKTAWGSRAVPSLVSPLDDLSVAPLRRAGFVILGKLATSEFGAMPVTEPDNHPPTRNPWDPLRTPGGSSGGSGAAVAAYLLPVAQASDGAGSIRIPAAFCNLFGLKPSRGLLPNQFGLRDPKILYTSGPLARSVDDAAALLDALAAEPGWRSAFGGKARATPRSFLALAQDEPRRLRIRSVTRSPVGSTDPEIVRAVERAARLLATLGHEVSEGVLPPATLEEFLPIWQRQLGDLTFLRWSWGRTQPVTRWLGLAGRALRPADVARAREALVARFLPRLAEADVWITPTVPTFPPPIGAFRDLPPEQAFAGAAPLGAFTALANLTGHPAASIPLGLSSSGLPMGLQVIGPPDADGEILSLARQLERAAPWSHLAPRPPFG